MANVTMKDFLQNPMGKFSSAGARRSDIIFNLEYRFKIILAVVKTINYKVFYNVQNEDYYLYFKIPSEKYNDLFYDVIIRFSLNPDSNKSRLSTYSIQVFSNSPNFLFTYAYVYNDADILIPFMKNKISKKALNEPPKIKNPKEEFGFEKSIYFALLYMKWNKLDLISNLKNNRLDYNLLNKFIDKIPNTELKLKQYNQAKKLKNLF